MADLESGASELDSKSSRLNQKVKRDVRFGHRQDQSRPRTGRPRRDSGRAAARREHRHGRARHGQFRADAAAYRQSARRLAEHRTPSAPPPAPTIFWMQCRTVRYRRAGGRRLHAAVCHHRPRARSGQAGGRARSGRPARSSAQIAARRHGRHPVRPRALRAAERGSRARQPHHHLSGQSRLRLAQPRPGGAADGL